MLRAAAGPLRGRRPPRSRTSGHRSAAWPDDHYSLDPSKALYYISGTMAALHRPHEVIEHAAEVVRQNENPATRNYWPTRVINARLEWATALADLGEEDEAYAMAREA